VCEANKLFVTLQSSILIFYFFNKYIMVLGVRPGVDFLYIEVIKCHCAQLFD
jgi:hypothetical protein